jgi:hypothetical protein
VSRPSKNSSTFGMINLQDLHVDPDVQRKMNPGWVKAHISVFDVDRLGYIVVNKRANGKYHVVDGQHRVELMRTIGWGDQKIHAEIFESLTKAQEAELFIARNDRKAVRKFDKFRVSVTAGDPVACGIDKIVREHGLVISDQQSDGCINAVEALERVYLGCGIASQQEGAVALAAALKVALQAWGNQPSSVSGRVIQALGMVQLRYNGGIDQKALAQKLAPFPGGAPSLLGKGRSMQDLRGRPLHHCIASIIVDTYNKGRKAGKLESWEA